MPSSMIADADAVARGGDAAVEPAPDRRRADDGRHAIGLREQLGLRRCPDVPDAPATAGRRQTAAHPARRESSLRGSVTTSASMTVRHVPAHVQPGRGAAEPRGRGALLARELGQREARAHAPQIDVPRASRNCASGARSDDRRGLQLDDDLGARGRGEYAARAQWRTPAAHRARRTRARAGSAHRTRCTPTFLICDEGSLTARGGTARDGAGGGRPESAGGRNRPPDRASSRCAA